MASRAKPAIIAGGATCAALSKFSKTVHYDINPRKINSDG